MFTGKKDLNKKKNIYFVFPYIKTSSKLTFFGLDFISSNKIEGVDDSVKKDLEEVTSLFYASSNYRIVEMVCGYVQVENDKEKIKKINETLRKIRLIFGYRYSHPYPSGGIFLPSESTELFVFSRGVEGMSRIYDDKIPSIMISPFGCQDTRVLAVGSVDNEAVGDLLEGFSVARDLSPVFHVSKQSRIYPPCEYVILNDSQDLFDDLKDFLENQHGNLLFRCFFYEQNSGLFEDIFAVSVDWYLKSCRQANSDEESIVYLAIALESLLQVGQEEKTERLGAAIITLLGKVPRLDSWFRQFYSARSAVVHEGRAKEMSFIATDLKRNKGESNNQEAELAKDKLIEYGYIIFRLCAQTILFGNLSSKDAHLESLFITNNQRIKNICKKLSNDGSEIDKLKSIFDETKYLNDDRSKIAQGKGFNGDDVFSSVKMVLIAFSKVMEMCTDDERSLINGTFGRHSKNGLDFVKDIKSVRDLLNKKDSHNFARDESIIRLSLGQLLSYATAPFVSLRYSYENQKKEKKNK